MDRLFTAVRKACRPGLWSQGVGMVREQAVVIESSTPEEVVARVKAPGRAIASTTVLYPADGEWTCDCAAQFDPCAHVAAVVIALHQEAGSDEPAPSSKPRPKLAYALSREQGYLVIHRAVVHPDGRREPFEQSLGSLLRRTGALGGLIPSQDDLAVDRLLVADRERLIGGPRAARLLSALSGCTLIEFEGRPVRTSPDPIVPCAVVRDESGSIVLRVEQSPEVTEVVSHRVALCDQVLRPIGAWELAGDRLERLPVVRRFCASELAELVTKVLPELEGHVTLEVLTERLPGTERRAVPRIHFEIEQPPGRLIVLPLLVYGDPPTARVDAGRLVHLGGPAPRRDENAEKDLVLSLRDGLNLVPGRRVVFEDREALAFATRLRAWDRSTADRRRSAPFPEEPLVPHFEVHGDDFEIRFELPSSVGRAFEGSSSGGGSSPANGGRADAQAVVRAWQDGFEMVPLLSGGWAPLPLVWLEKHGHALAELLAARDPSGRTPRAMLPALAELCAELEHPPPPTFEQLAPLLSGPGALPEPELPPRIAELVRPYQRDGIRWLSFLRNAGLGALLADDMGLGKTLQSLAAVRGRTLVVCPRSVLHNWAAEAERFRPELRVSIYHGPDRGLDPNADLTLTSYALLRLDEERLQAVSWDTLIFDEAQNIKNPDSQVTRAAYGLKANFRVALSGTPVENRLDELWSAMHATNPGLLGGRTSFHERFAAPIGRGDPGSAQRLARRVRPFLLRRLKRDVLTELPPRLEATLHVDLTSEERGLYDALRAAARREVLTELGAGKNVLAALEALLRLRQAACHSALLPGQCAECSSKVEQLLEALEVAAADGHKALVFSQWTSLLDLIEPHLSAANIAFERLDGSTRDRAGVVERFQSESGPPVMLTSLKAGGTGLNLTAADHVFLMDPWWNPAVEDQAADRAHRIGQERPVTVYRLVARDTVEEKILLLQEKKRALAEIAVGTGVGGGSTEMTREELMELLA
ncbi:MAG: DEAD/DEAH box helicase [Polyangiaceae bacterium]|nr:DEAD/DEAH box helicase [Polyangiaceae bacterium]